MQPFWKWGLPWPYKVSAPITGAVYHSWVGPFNSLHYTLWRCSFSSHKETESTWDCDCSISIRAHSTYPWWTCSIAKKNKLCCQAYLWLHTKFSILIDAHHNLRQEIPTCCILTPRRPSIIRPFHDQKDNIGLFLSIHLAGSSFTGWKPGPDYEALV